MNFDLSKEQRLIQSNVREFMSKEIGPIAEKIDEEDFFPPGLWTKLGGLGLLGLSTGEAYGAHTNLCAHNLERNGTDQQKRKYLPGLCSGEFIGCLGLTEPGAGSDAVGIETTAERDGDHFILNGNKMFITNGPIADIAIVYAKTDQAAGARGITSFIVEKNSPGFSVSGHIKKMGHRGSPTGELIFNDCRVPVENVLGEINNGIKVMMTGLDVERVIVAGISLGIGVTAMELALKYAKKRHQFGKPICSFQLVKAKLANMYTKLEAARGLIYRAAVMADKIRSGGKGTEVHRLAAAAILFVAEASSRAVNDSLQIHGGYGYTLEYSINRFFRDAKLYEIGAGTSEIRRLIIADELIKKGLQNL